MDNLIWWFTATAGAIAINLIASELFAWGPRLSEWLMRRAVRRVAPQMRDRMQEEWAGHLQTIPPGLWRIVAAIGFCLATRQINVAVRVRKQRKKAKSKVEGITLTVGPGMGKSAVVIEYLARHLTMIEAKKQEGF